MTVTYETCIVCKNKTAIEINIKPGKDCKQVKCDICGYFFATSFEKFLSYSYDPDDDGFIPNVPTERVIRATLSHWIRCNQPSASETWPKTEDMPLVNKELVVRCLKKEFMLPTPSEQVTKALRYIGDEIRHTGEGIEGFPQSFTAVIGAYDRNFAMDTIDNMAQSGLVNTMEKRSAMGDFFLIKLTLQGWDRYEEERKGHIASNYGFLALKFGDKDLDPFITDYVKPWIKDMGYELVDLRDRSRAGVIDNVMRQEIRNAKFILADLTHDNAGAYWEAGYAEGLGKPVIYLCEKEKFNMYKTHFDTNHCTTILWDVEKPTTCLESLSATLSRSITPPATSPTLLHSRIA